MNGRESDNVLVARRQEHPELGAIDVFTAFGSASVVEVAPVALNHACVASAAYTALATAGDAISQEILSHSGVTPAMGALVQEECIRLGAAFQRYAAEHGLQTEQTQVPATPRVLGQTGLANMPFIRAYAPGRVN